MSDAAGRAGDSFGGAVIAIKVGGEIVASDVVHAVAADIATIVARGDRVVMIHGGGPQATAMQKTLGIEPNIVAGRRVTDEPTLDVIKMVVGGRLNIDLCAALMRAGVRPVGLHGASARVLGGRKRPPRVMAGAGPDPVDYGLVGDIVAVNCALLDLLMAGGYVPVIACLAADEDGRVLNVNADVAANHVAIAVAADHLVLVTGTPGVLRDVADPSTRIPRLTVREAHAAIADGTVTGGMIPKLEESIQVVESGRVGSIHIIGDVDPGQLLAEIDAPGAIGTALLADPV